ncbi:hypothetical protein IW139_000417 [Coemansia sp. RSA 353]|nr:hypothetical protein GGH17_000403 [Coemansia sp. RSA 788]KAJ2149111.1 hypothetical protein IW142_000393 [Coemansia sp. RSA 564]KAJ2169934.1 hypothetical protein GGH15_000026 [Coemansia sp. RSA 562]KAJ2176305.1 hypothetical protein GGH16_000177 [Coemansia sp. RSA 560]KAJ2191272.1 hypothetical protein EV181_000452 [Coemansia sp. RSA 532]KAJ2199956.1 hypothetical protein GGH18_000159 [Coemansia sp. RSA 530]KAJ2201044.1 hypothetical protein IW144_000657 [Coemansia sp. RSA 522]KAJ2208957.1 hyp
MEQHVFEALQGTLSADDTVRQNSEQALKRLELDTGFPLAAANIALADEAGLAERQAAIVQIRGYVSRHWSIGSAKYEPGPIPDQQAKAQVREKVFLLLTSANRKLRMVAAAVVANMAVYDWPDEWPQLFSQLVELLHGSHDQVQAALSVFGEWVNSDMSEQQLDQIGVLIPELRRIFGSSDYSSDTHVLAVRVFTDCIDIIAIMSDTRREFVDAHVPPILREWIDHILHAIRQPLASSNNGPAILLKTECVKALVKIVIGIPRYIGPHSPAILEALWSQLQELQEPYLHAFVYQDSAHSESATNMLVYCEDDGDANTIDNYLCGMFEWISRAAESKPVRKFFVEKSKDSGALNPTLFFKQLAASLICYAQITTDMLEDWADDMDLFVADEDEDGYRFNVRVSVQELIQSLDDVYTRPLALALGWAAQARSELANQWRNEQNGNWWLVSESALWALGLASSSAAVLSTDNAGSALSMSSILDSDVWPLAQSSSFPYGQGRAFIFASNVAQDLPSDVATAFVGASANAVADVQLHPAVRLSAVRAISNFCRHLSADLVKPHQSQFINGLASIIPQLSEDSAHIALEALHFALRVDQDITASLEPVISEVAMGVWQKYPGDVLLTSIVIDIVEDMAGNVSAREAFSQRALPVIGAAITQATDGMVVSSGIDLLTGLLKGVPTPMPAGYTETIFPVLMQVLTASSDSEVLQSGQACLKYFVQKDAERVAQWHDENGKSGLEHIVHFIAVMLSPDASESAALFIGDLVAKVVQKCGAYIAGNDFAELVRIVTARLATAHTSSFCASNIPFYSQLVIRHPTETVSLLSSMEFGGRSGLEVVLSVWFKSYLDVQGYYNRKISAVALTRLFTLNDARINSLVVPGDLIPNAANNGKIVTRSMSRTNPDQFTQIPASAKIIKLLLAEIEMDVESTFARSGGAGLSAVIDEDELDNDGGDDGWEDDGGDGLGDTDAFGYLDDLAGSDFDDDDDEDDEDIQADPIYNQDLNEALGSFFKQAVQSDQSSFRTSIVPLLTDREQTVLSKICS